MSFVLFVWLFLFFVFLGAPILYFLYLRRVVSRPWNIKLDESYAPSLTVLIPTHNEEKTIGYKLENLYHVKYPKEKLQVILGDDASTDQTVHLASLFVNSHPELNTEIIKENERKGKSTILNLALKSAQNDVVIVTDSDAFWDPNILVKALPYLADPSVGAVIGRQKVLNSEQSWITQGEKIYLDLTFGVIRLGESLIHSTIISHGGFCAYKRTFLSEFNSEADDSGTAFDVVQKGARTLYVPEAICFDVASVTWKSRFSTKVRRASQLVQIYGKCLKLLLKNQLSLPKRIAIPEIFLYLFNPVVFLLLTLATLILIPAYLPYSLAVLFILLLPLTIPKGRLLLIEVVQNNCILLGALLASMLRRKFLVWNTSDESRSLLTRDMLESKNLL